MTHAHSTWFSCVLLCLSGYICGSSPCVNGASCVDVFKWPEQYTCSCVAGYTGTHCETGELMGMANTYTQIMPLGILFALRAILL